MSLRRARRSLAVLLAATACAHGPAQVATASSDATPPSTSTSTSTSTPIPTAPSTRDASPGSASAPSDPAEARLAAIRAEVDALLAAQAIVFWEMWTRGAAATDPAAGHDALFSADTLAFVRGARARAQGDERRALDLLHAFLLGEHLSRAAAGAPEPPAAAVAWGGRTVAAVRVPALLAAEADAPRRAALERAWVEAERKNGPALEARWRALAAAAAKAGYPSLLALAAELRGETPDTLTVLAESVLATTDAAYRSLLGGVAQLELGRRLAELRGRDLPRLFRVAEEPQTFPAGRLAADAQGALAAVGLDLAGRAGVVLDGDARPGKDPRALALPVAVPGDVRVSFTPVAGASELRGLLHELGAAAFYAHVTESALEFRRLGAVTAETWAALFEGLAGDPAWLAERTGLSEPHLARLVRAGAARQLHEARALAARILVEVGRAGGPAFTPAIARTVIERAFARPVENEELELFLGERDPLLHSADALRALLLAAQADAFLRARAPAPWWRAPEAGALLGAAFAEGSRLAPPALARSLGAASVDAAALDATARSRAAAVGLRLAGAP